MKRWWLLLFLTLALSARGEELSGALQPVEDTALTCEHLVVRVEASPSGSRIRLDAMLLNPTLQQADATLMLLDAPQLRVEREEAPVELETVKTREHRVKTFLVRLDPGERTHLTARWLLPGRSLRIKLPEPGMWNGYESCSLLVHARQSWRIAITPQMVPVSQTLDEVIYGASLGPNQAPWLEVELSYRGLPVFLWLLVLPAVASLAAGALAQAWPGPPAGRAVLLAYLMNTPVYLWLSSEGLTAWQPGPLSLLVCFALGPVIAALYSVLGFPRRGILR